MGAHSKHPKDWAEQSTDNKCIVIRNNNQSDTEDANSEIRKFHFLVQENKWGSSQE